MANPPYPAWLAREERKADRQPARLSGTAASVKVAEQPVHITDLSALGCRLHVAEPMRVGNYVTLTSGSAPRLAGWVIWSKPTECGIDFAHPLPDVVVEQMAAQG